MSLNAPIPRLAGRVVLLDGAGDVLLVHEREPGAGSRWLTPGGGVEGRELPAEAAVRELYEETGIELQFTQDVPAWHVDRFVWSIDGVAYDQVNHYFLARLADVRPAVRPAALTAYEADVVLGSRWWPPADLVGTAETVYPRALGAWLTGSGAGPTPGRRP